MRIFAVVQPAVRYIENMENDLRQNKGQCLAQDNGSPVCEVERVISNEYLVVKMKFENRGCPSAMSFGNAYICKHPIRSEIYRKHGK